ncbi:hypothetical protein [Thermococcus camini]|uniref:hypothetical protein n=1 Tax=Thermococcus camini TaxID=2016373 RepID=UPI001FE816E9|nr:hypothetical protein [Thermococcus camini]
MVALFKLNWGRIGIYFGVVALVYALSSRAEPLSTIREPSVILALFMTAREVAKGVGRELLAGFLVPLGLSTAALLIPIPEWRIPLALISFGTGVALTAPNLEERARVVRGVGVFLALYGLSRTPPLMTYGSVFSYTGAAFLLGYATSELVERYPWVEVIERNLLGIGALGGVLGLYVSVRGELSESHPELVFYGEWLVLVLGVVLAGSMVYSHVAEHDPERYLLEQWRRHEAKTLERLGPEMMEARRAVEDFVVRGRRGPLVAFVTYYGARLFGDREEFGALISKVADYEGKTVSPLMPLWIRRRYERAELERRERIVKEVFEGLRDLMGWKP